MLKNKINTLPFYILFIIIFIIFIKFSTEKVLANSYKVSDIEISEPYNLNFSKEKVIDIAFENAFEELIFTLLTSEYYYLNKDVNIKIIKSLIDSFSIVDEKFIDKKYIANFDVNFNKREVLNYLYKNNIYASIPQKKKLFLLPILVDTNQSNISLLSENPFYLNWTKFDKKYHLLDYVLPNEDLDDLNIIKNNINNLEDYEFKEIITKYQLKDYIIVILFKNEKSIRVLTRIKFNNEFILLNENFPYKILNDDIELIINSLKISYENSWKKINLINTSIKLPITISLDSSKFSLIKKFENKIENMDLVYNYYIESFSNNEVIYKIVYNGTPNKFLEEFNPENIKVDLTNNIWKIDEN
tara:strand:- start:2514 stop:3587 length:1074 start_codon:yes stop_codon:yes gene_type:complete